MRAILAFVAILFLTAACSATGDSASRTTPKAAANIDPAAVTPEYVASLPRSQATAAIESMIDHYLALAIERCPGRADACLNEQFEAAFDQTGQLAPLCAVNGLGSEYKLCLMVAAETVPMVTAAGGNPATDIDWSDVDSTNNEARKQFADFVVTKKCGADRACIVEQMSALLDLSPAVGKSCQVHEALSDRLSCVSDAKSAAVYQRAIRSLS